MAALNYEQVRAILRAQNWPTAPPDARRPPHIERPAEPKPVPVCGGLATASDGTWLVPVSRTSSWYSDKRESWRSSTERIGWRAPTEAEAASIATEVERIDQTYWLRNIQPALGEWATYHKAAAAYEANAREMTAYADARRTWLQTHPARAWFAAQAPELRGDILTKLAELGWIDEDEHEAGADALLALASEQ